MGIFTYRQTKKTKREVQALRQDQARQAQAAQNQAAKQAREQRETELFQALPPEGKEEFRAVVAAFEEKAATWTNFKVMWGGKEVVTARQTLKQGKEDVFRKYDLIP
jgi:hypothetical protein